MNAIMGSKLIKAVLILWRLIRLGIKVDYYHLPQPLGVFIDKEQLHGYYNDLRLKAKWTGERDEQGIPVSKTTLGKRIYFPTTIIQYGLGHYDLWLETHQESHLQEVLKVAEWLLAHQDESGGWDVFGKIQVGALNNYSAITQGEAVSLLLRAYKETHDERYLIASKRAITLMLKPVNQGGTALYKDNGDLFLEEVPLEKQNTILNGWIFAIFGLWDYTLIVRDNSITQALINTLDTLERHINKYDRGWWSNYDWQGSIASPFYHRLHIALLQALYKLTERSAFHDIAIKWQEYDRSSYKKGRAVLVKVWEKLKTSGEVLKE